MTLMLLACSSSKKEGVERCMAREMYTGTLFKKSLQYADENYMPTLILSAKYGFITPETTIDIYNERRKKPYTGPWPKGSGFYVGGKAYYGKAPDRFQPLVINPRGLGYWISGVHKLLKPASEFDFEKARRWHLFRLLLQKPVTKLEAKEHVDKFVRPDPNTASFIEEYFCQEKIGDEWGCIFVEHEYTKYALFGKPGVDLT